MPSLYHLTRVCDRLLSQVLTPEHARDLFNALRERELTNRAVSAISVKFFGDLEVAVCVRGYLWEVGDTDHLSTISDALELDPHTLSDSPTYPSVDLIEHISRRMIRVHQDNLQREHQSRQLAARGDSR